MVNFQQDQAAGLRRIMAAPKPRIVSVISAHNRSNDNDLSRLLGNLAASLTLNGSNPHIVYAAPPDVDALKFYGLLQTPSLSKVIQQQQPLASAISSVCRGFTSSRLCETIKVDCNITYELSQHIKKLADAHEIVIVETVINDQHSLPLELLNQSFIVFQLSEKAAAIKQTYTLIKQLYNNLGKRPFGILVHGTSAKSAESVFKNIDAVSRQYLGCELEYMGYIPTDEYINKAYKMGRTVVDAFPKTIVSKAFRDLATKFIGHINDSAKACKHSIILDASC